MLSKAGATLTAFCPSCERECPHNVIYAERKIHHLRCSACKIVNVFVYEEPEGAHMGVPQDYSALMQRRGSRALCTYSTTGAYTEGQYIRHPKFGEGYVLAVRSPPVKMEVFFEDMKRLLVCGSILGARKEEEAEPSQGDVVKPGKRSRAVRAKRESGPLANDEASRPPRDLLLKCTVCGCAVHPLNLARSPDGRIVGCIRCR